MLKEVVTVTVKPERRKKLLIKLIGRARLASSATGKIIRRHTAQRQRRSTRLTRPTRMMMQQALLAPSTNSRKRSRRRPKRSQTVSDKLEKLKEAESNLSGSDAEEEASHFQYSDAFQFAQLKSKFEPSNFKQLEAFKAITCSYQDHT